MWRVLSGDLVKDTLGFSLPAADLAAKMQHAPLFFKFYGPGRHVRELTRLEVSVVLCGELAVPFADGALL